MNTTTTYDKPRLLTDQFHGQRGPLFEMWKKPYLDAGESKGDDDASSLVVAQLLLHES